MRIIHKNGSVMCIDQKGKIDGIIPSKRYKIIYKLNEVEKTASMIFSGKDLLKGVSGLSQHFTKEFEKSDIYEMIAYSRQVVVAWGTLSISRNIEMRNQIAQVYGNDLLEVLTNYLDGDQSFQVFIRDMISGYMCLSKMRYSATNYRENVLHLHDVYFNHMDPNELNGILDHWDKHDITERKGLKSREDFSKLLEQGSLSVEWTEKRII